MMGRRSIFQACITYLCRYFFSAYTQSNTHTHSHTQAHQCIKTLNITRNVMNHTDFVSHSSGNNSLPWSGLFSSFWILSRFIFFSLLSSIFFSLHSMYLFPKLWPETKRFDNGNLLFLYLLSSLVELFWSFCFSLRFIFRSGIVLFDLFWENGIKKVGYWYIIRIGVVRLQYKWISLKASEHFVMLLVSVFFA